MKLRSLDRTESLKEEREVGDTLALWSSNIHVFNAFLAKHHGSEEAAEKGKRMKVGILNEGLMRVRIEQGAIKGEGPGDWCCVCGLKREERVSGVDDAVEDSFGEWWIGFWVHRGCWELWETWRGLLKGR